MSIDKEKAARIAAAKHSVQPVSAVLHYISLTEQTELINTDKKVFKKMQAEMYSMLKPYRHPANDKLAESMIFFGPDSIQLNMTGCQDPPFIKALEKEKIPNDLLANIKEYVQESELRIIALGKCENKLHLLEEKISTAQQIYDKLKSSRPDHRNSQVVKAMGLSTGYRPKRLKKKTVYVDYVNLVRKKGMSREDAVEIVKEKYVINSEDSTLRHLHDHRKTVIDKWGQKYPSTTPEIKKRLRGLIPSRR